MAAILVDDTLSAGTEKFRLDLKRTHKAFDLSTCEEGNILRYGGVTIDQSSPTITVCQSDYIETITKLPVTGVNVSDIRSGRGRPSWVTTWTRADHARAIAHISQATENTISNGTIKQLNEVIAGLQAKPDHMLRYAPMKMGQSKLVAFSDASFACNDDLSSQIAGIILLCDNSVNAHILDWFSKKSLLRCKILGGAIHGDFIVVRTFARNAQQNRDREA
jgi:hypothetical protein